MTRNVQCPVCRGRFATGVTEPGARFLCPYCQTELALATDAGSSHDSALQPVEEFPGQADRKREGEA